MGVLNLRRQGVIVPKGVLNLYHCSYGVLNLRERAKGSYNFGKEILK
jgi:hypothetical protein